MATTRTAPATLDDLLDEAFERRRTAGLALLTESEALARACSAMAERFRVGGRLLAFGSGNVAPDAQHVAVEFLHPVIVGKRALPAIALTNDAALLTGVIAAEGPDELFAGALRVLGGHADIALGLSPDGRCAGVARGLGAARRLGMLTLALSGGERDAPVPSAAEHRIVVTSPDGLAVKEAFVTAYHVLWELVHVFLEHPGPGRRDDG
jgi:D-sedoheptulose 7-phosphate isomerase